MEKGDSKYIVLAVERILQDNSNGVSVKEIIRKLEYEYGVNAERRTIYNNIDVLGWFFIIKKKRCGKEHLYCIEKSDNLVKEMVGEDK